MLEKVFKIPKMLSERVHKLKLLQFQLKTDLKIKGAGEMAHWLRTHTALAQN